MHSVRNCSIIDELADICHQVTMKSRTVEDSRTMRRCQGPCYDRRSLRCFASEVLVMPRLDFESGQCFFVYSSIA